jgi:hypothetical protein
MALLVTAAIGVTLAGCTTADPPDPVGERQRSQIRASILRDNWAEVLREFPGVDPPLVPFMRTVTDHDRPIVLVACLRRNGIHSTWLDDGTRYSLSFGPREFARRSVACSVQYPAESEVISHLAFPQRAALFKYRRDTVHSCLLSIGMPSPAPPPGAARPTDRIGLLNWNPYRDVWRSGLSPGALSFLEQRCPPIPIWLDLAG